MKRSRYDSPFNQGDLVGFSITEDGDWPLDTPQDDLDLLEQQYAAASAEPSDEELQAIELAEDLE